MKPPANTHTVLEDNRKPCLYLRKGHTAKWEYAELGMVRTGVKINEIAADEIEQVFWTVSDEPPPIRFHSTIGAYSRIAHEYAENSHIHLDKLDYACEQLWLIGQRCAERQGK